MLNLAPTSHAYQSIRNFAYTLRNAHIPQMKDDDVENLFQDVLALPDVTTVRQAGLAILASFRRRVDIPDDVPVDLEEEE